MAICLIVLVLSVFCFFIFIIGLLKFYFGTNKDMYIFLKYLSQFSVLESPLFMCLIVFWWLRSVAVIKGNHIQQTFKKRVLLQMCHGSHAWF